MTWRALSISPCVLAWARCALDSAAAQPCTFPAHFTALADGEHVFQVSAADAAGNEATVEVRWTVVTGWTVVTAASSPESPGASVDDDASSASPSSLSAAGTGMEGGEGTAKAAAMLPEVSAVSVVGSTSSPLRGPFEVGSN
jgi:hypothetical protein